MKTTENSGSTSSPTIGTKVYLETLNIGNNWTDTNVFSNNPSFRYFELEFDSLMSSTTLDKTLGAFLYWSNGEYDSYNCGGYGADMGGSSQFGNNNANYMSLWTPNQYGSSTLGAFGSVRLYFPENGVAFYTAELYAPMACDTGGAVTIVSGNYINNDSESCTGIRILFNSGASIIFGQVYVYGCM